MVCSSSSMWAFMALLGVACTMRRLFIDRLAFSRAASTRKLFGTSTIKMSMSLFFFTSPRAVLPCIIEFICDISSAVIMAAALARRVLSLVQRAWL